VGALPIVYPVFLQSIELDKICHRFKAAHVKEVSFLERISELDKFLGFVKLCWGGRKMEVICSLFNPFLMP